MNSRYNEKIHKIKIMFLKNVYAEMRITHYDRVNSSLNTKSIIKTKWHWVYE